MNRKKTSYHFINLAVILAAVGLFVHSFRDIPGIWRNTSLSSFLILIIAILLIHTIKAARLYLALYGSEVRQKDYLKTYCKVTPVSVIFPFKLGEFFRMYCYGRLIGNGLKGIIIILFDRFMDTSALVTMIFLVWAAYGGKPSALIYVLLAFLALIILAYLTFPGISRFWKDYLLRVTASRQRLAVLRIIAVIDSVYHEIEEVAKGRGILLYSFSLTAWGVEIGTLFLLSGFSGDSNTGKIISDYLLSAVNGGSSAAMERFIFASVILLMIGYIGITLWEISRTKKRSAE